MPLMFSGKMFPAADGPVSIEAHDSGTRQRVNVRISGEAIEDYGLSRAQQVASEKYDARQFEGDGKSIFVRTGDCA
jgi:hypothetical protein